MLLAIEQPHLAEQVHLTVYVEHTEGVVVLTLKDRIGELMRGEVSWLTWRTCGRKHVLETFVRRVKHQYGENCVIGVAEIKK